MTVRYLPTLLFVYYIEWGDCKKNTSYHIFGCAWLNRTRMHCEPIKLLSFCIIMSFAKMHSSRFLLIAQAKMSFKYLSVIEVIGFKNHTGLISACCYPVDMRKSIIE